MRVFTLVETNLCGKQFVDPLPAIAAAVWEYETSLIFMAG